MCAEAGIAVAAALVQWSDVMWAKATPGVALPTFTWPHRHRQHRPSRRSSTQW